MVNAIEFRIGNLYLDLNGLPSVWEFGRHDWNYFKPEEMEAIMPIPISEEWLKKFGFIEMEDIIPEGYPTFMPPKAQARVYYSDSNELYNWAVYQFPYIDDQIVISSLKYIHQLQNLYFAITGMDLTIVD